MEKNTPICRNEASWEETKNMRKAPPIVCKSFRSESGSICQSAPLLWTPVHARGCPVKLHALCPPYRAAEQPGITPVVSKPVKYWLGSFCSSGERQTPVGTKFTPILKGRCPRLTFFCHVLQATWPTCQPPLQKHQNKKGMRQAQHKGLMPKSSSCKD